MDRHELALECEEIEKGGWSVREFLREVGCISPWGTWFRLQKEELGRRESQITNGKGREEMGKMTKADRERIVDAALAGENPLKVLKEMGNPNPSAAWTYIKKVLKAANPERYGQLMSRVVVADIQKAMAGDAPETAPVTTCCAPARPSGVEVPDELPEEEPASPEVVMTIKSEDLMTVQSDEIPKVIHITKPVNYDGFEVTGLKAEYGRFQLSNNGYLFFGANSDDELEMPVELWRRFAADLPRVMQILGIA